MQREPLERTRISSLLCTQRVRSKFSANDSREERTVSPKTGTDPDFLRSTPGFGAAAAAGLPHTVYQSFVRSKARISLF